MRVKGKITHWNPDKGYGFITPASGAKQVFMHISALRNRSLPPQVGQAVDFVLSQDAQGRPRATDVAREGDPALRAPRHRKPRQRFGAGKVLMGLLLLAAAVGWHKYRYTITSSMGSHSLTAPVIERLAPSSEFHCDSRKYCSQMTSCEEAKYFVRNCGNTTMDGDGDGDPCERQWCTW